MAIAVFDPTQFLARYPEFSAVSITKLQAYFLEAGLYLNNTDCSPLCDVVRRGLLLNMLVAHISKLGGDLSADGQAMPVGRMSQAGEGTVSASFEYSTQTPGSKAWFDQTQYGAAFWQATVSLRSFRYSPRPTRY
jgi:hypothetical protein